MVHNPLMQFFTLGSSKKISHFPELTFLISWPLTMISHDVSVCRCGCWGCHGGGDDSTADYQGSGVQGSQGPCFMQQSHAFPAVLHASPFVPVPLVGGGGAGIARRGKFWADPSLVNPRRHSATGTALRHKCSCTGAQPVRWHGAFVLRAPFNNSAPLGGGGDGGGGSHTHWPGPRPPP